MPALLEIRELESRFPGGVVAVDGVDLTIAPGELVCLVGESGCGKSALALSILGLMPGGAAAHPRGSIRFEGTELIGADEATWQRIRGAGIGMVFQEPTTALNPVMRIGEQVAEPLWLHGLATRAEARARAVEALRRVGIPDPEQVARRYPHELSGGMRQRAMIAAATISQPKLLVADEPTTALDVTIEAQILDLIRTLRDETGMAVLLITHDLGIVAQLAERVVVMYAGQIVEVASVTELFAAPRHPYTEGLLASMPRPGVRGRLAAIPGRVPPPHARPAGCRFRPRCPYAEPACAEEVPLTTWGPDHWTRCRRPEVVGHAFLGREEA